jgi:mRNA interferase RelE/StbE
MAYQIIIKRPAEKELDALPASVRERIVRHLLALEDNPRPVGIKKLQGEDGFRLHVGGLPGAVYDR